MVHEDGKSPGRLACDRERGSAIALHRLPRDIAKDTKRTTQIFGESLGTLPIDEVVRKPVTGDLMSPAVNFLNQMRHPLGIPG